MQKNRKNRLKSKVFFQFTLSTKEVNFREWETITILRYINDVMFPANTYNNHEVTAND